MQCNKGKLYREQMSNQKPCVPRVIEHLHLEETEIEKKIVYRILSERQLCSNCFTHK